MAVNSSFRCMGFGVNGTTTLGSRPTLEVGPKSFASLKSLDPEKWKIPFPSSALFMFLKSITEAISNGPSNSTSFVSQLNEPTSWLRLVVFVAQY